MYKKLKRNVHFLAGVERGKSNKKNTDMRYSYPCFLCTMPL